VTALNECDTGGIFQLADIPFSAALDTAVLPVKAIQKLLFYSGDKKQVEAYRQVTSQ
jgi:hypothetical protein